MIKNSIIIVIALFLLTKLIRRQHLSFSTNYLPKIIGSKGILTFELYSSKATILIIAFCCIFPCAQGCNPNCIGCDAQFNCWRCIPGFYISGKFCYSCGGIANCLNCNGYTTSCTTCAYGYVVTAPQSCYPCAAYSNCLQCNYNSYMIHCTRCATGFTVNPSTTTCMSCLSAMVGCATCSSTTVCTTCVNSTFMLDSTAKCQICWQAYYQCYLCDSTSCYQCNSGFYLLPSLNCTPCSTTLENCKICPDANTCTQCVSNQFYLDAGHCILCAAIFPYCQTCTQTRCLSCSKDFYLSSNLTCKCKKGQPVSGYCISVPGCSSAMLYKNVAQCLTCASNDFIYNTSTVRCDCKKGIMLGTQCSQLYGCITMIAPDRVQVCVMCDVTKHFYLEDGRCVCLQGYVVSQVDNNCEEVCGDGVLIYLPCDDGNTIDGDGCSSKCKIEKKFQCFNGSITTPSKCLSILTDFSFELLQISKIAESDTAAFEFHIINFDPFISTLNWKDIFYLEIAQEHKVVDINLRGNFLTIKVNYDQDLEGRHAKLMLNLSSNFFIFPEIVNFTFPMVSSNAPLVLMTYPNPNTLQILSTILLCLCITALILLFTAAILHKMVGIETLSVLQMFAAAPYLITDRSAVLRLFDRFSLANGFGKSLYYDKDNAQTFGETFEDLGLPKSFTENMLIDEGILISSVILFLLGLFAINWFLRSKKSQKEQKLRYFVEVFCNNLLFSLSIGLFFVTFISINANNFRVYEHTYSGVKFESTSDYSKFNPLLNTSTFFIIVLIISIVYVLNMLTPTALKIIIMNRGNAILIKLYQSFQSLNLKSKLYITFFIINHLLIFSLITIFLFKQSQYGIFVLFFSMLPFSISVIIFRPYKKFIDNVGVCLGQIALFLFISSLCVKQFLWIHKITIQLTYELIASIIFTALLFIFLLISLARLVVFKLQQNRKKSKNREALIEAKIPETQNQSIYDIKPADLHKPLNKLRWPSADTQEFVKLKNKLKNNLLDKRTNMFRNKGELF